MSEYLIQDTTLISLADNVRVLNGNNETMTPIEMASNLNNYNDELNTVLTTQDDLITQLANALEGKIGIINTSSQYSCIASINSIQGGAGYNGLYDKNDNIISLNSQGEIDLSDYIGDIVYVRGDSNAEIPLHIAIDEDNEEVSYTTTTTGSGLEIQDAWRFIVPRYNITIIHDPGDTG